MSDSIIPVITNSGLNALFNAQNNGLQITITEIALGDSGWEPDNNATALQNIKKRLPVSGKRINEKQIHLTGVEDDSELEYWVREIGFYLDDGTLFAIWSSSEQALAYKTIGIDLVLAFDLMLDALPTDSVTVDGSGGFNLPPATDQKRGIIRIATQTEATDGIATDIAITPAQLAVATHETTILNNILESGGEGSGINADLVRDLPANFDSVLEKNGFQKLPSGLILQWGIETSFYNTGGHESMVQRTVTFPIAFPTTYLHISLNSGEVCAIPSSRENVEHIFEPIAISNTELTILARRWAGFANGAHDTFSCRWLAIGY